MSKNKFLLFVTMIVAAAVLAWSSGDALAQGKVQKATPGDEKRKVIQESVKKDVAAKGMATTDDAAKFFGKVTPSEQKAAAKRARQLGLYPGVAGRSVQAPVTAPAPQTP